MGHRLLFVVSCLSWAAACGGELKADDEDNGGGGSAAADSGGPAGTDTAPPGSGDSGALDDSGGSPPDPDDSGAPPVSDADGDGFTVEEGDCDDDDPLVRPGADEVCNERDDDCDGDVDEDPLFAENWYRDADGDGFGDISIPVPGCTAPEGYVAGGTMAYHFDCNDADAGVYPGADELCDGADNDCDGVIDEDPVDALTLYTDADGDGYGAAESGVMSCEAAAGLVADGTDCDDDAATVHPGAVEYCDGLDNDCDGEVDTDAVFGTRTWHMDADGDGHGDPLTSLVGCGPYSGYVLDASDCDDADPTRHPDYEEVCDGVDNDCDDVIDEDEVCL